MAGVDANMLIILGTLAALFGYFLGSIPFGLILARLAGQGDIREIGSGNIGATNVLRTGRKDIAFITLLLDAGKAGLAFLAIKYVFGVDRILPEIAAASALLGHCFPIWLKFKGGKGVATFFGGVFAGSWSVGLIAGAIWLSSAIVTRYSSLSALLAAAASPIIAYFMGHETVAAMAAFMAFIIFIRHRENIGRLLKGQETKIGDKSK